MFTNWYNAQFPEALYPAINQQQYAARVISGGIIASGANVGVVGLTRNTADIIGYNLNRIVYLSRFFKNLKCLIFENDSTDGTPDIISKFISTQDEIEMHLATMNMEKVRHEQNKSVDRRRDMAFYRNSYLTLIEKMGWDLDYLIIIDTDLAGGFSYEGIFNSLGYENEWSLMGSNGILYRQNKNLKFERLQFDTWAYRHYGSWEEVCGEEGNRMTFERGQDPIPVFSCFGGLCIYKYSDIIGLRYNDEDCDHVTLNKQLINRGKQLFVNPSQITLYNQHSYMI